MATDPLNSHVSDTARWVATYRAVESARPDAGLMQSAPFKFTPANGLACFEDLGWRAVEVESVFTTVHRSDRLLR